MARYTIDQSLIRIDTDLISAAVQTQGYTSGVQAGSFLHKRSGARDLGFGLSIVDFLLEPADATSPVPPGQYEFGNLTHGNIAKPYVEGPQTTCHPHYVARRQQA